jgi:hypothetical protein
LQAELQKAATKDLFKLDAAPFNNDMIILIGGLNVNDPCAPEP